MSTGPRELLGSAVPADGAPGGPRQWLMSWLGEGPARHLGGTGDGHLGPLGTQLGCERVGRGGPAVAGGRQLPLRPLATAGRVAGHSWVLGQAVSREVVELGLPRGRVPPSACAPLGLCLLEASATSPVDPVYLWEQRTEASVAVGDGGVARVQVVHSLKERQRPQSSLCESVAKHTEAETAVAEDPALGRSPGDPWCLPPRLCPGKGQVWGLSPRGRPLSPSCSLMGGPGPGHPQAAPAVEKPQETRVTMTPTASAHGSARPWTSHVAHKR